MTQVNRITDSNRPADSEIMTVAERLREIDEEVDRIISRILMVLVHILKVLAKPFPEIAESFDSYEDAIEEIKKLHQEHAELKTRLPDELWQKST